MLSAALISDDDVFRTLEALPSKDLRQRYDQVKTLDRKKRMASRKSSSRRGDISRLFSSVDTPDADVATLMPDDVTADEKRRRLDAVKALTGSLDTKRKARFGNQLK